MSTKKRMSLTGSWLSRSKSTRKKPGLTGKRSSRVISTGGFGLRKKRPESRRSRTDSRTGSRVSLQSSFKKSRRLSRKVSNNRFQLTPAPSIRKSSMNSQNSRNSNNSEALKQSLQTIFGQDVEIQSFGMSFKAKSVASSKKSIPKPREAANFAEIDMKVTGEKCCHQKGVSLSFLKSLMRRLRDADFLLFEVTEDTTVDTEEDSVSKVKYPKQITLKQGDIFKVDGEEWAESKNNIDVVGTCNRVSVEYEADQYGIGLFVTKDKIKRVDPMDFTLRHILQEIIWGETSEHSASLVDNIEEKHLSEDYIFVSCALDARYSDLLRSLLQLERDMKAIGKTEKSPYFWIDVFCVNFHLPSAALFLPEHHIIENDDIASTRELKTQQQGIIEINDIVRKSKAAAIFCTSVDKPLFTKSTLAIWQIYCVSKSSKKIELLLGTKTNSKLKENIVESYDMVLNSISIAENRTEDKYFNFFKSTIASYVDTNTLEWAVANKLKRAFLRQIEYEMLDSEASLGKKERVHLRKKLAETYRKELGLPSKALNHLRECMRTLSRPKDKVPIMVELGIVLRATGRMEAAEACYTELLKQMDKLIGRKQTSTAAVLVALGETLKERGKFSEAQDYLLEALEIRKDARAKKLKTEDDKVISQSPGVIECLYGLGDCVRLEGDFEMAVGYCDQMLEALEQVFTQDDTQYKKVKFYVLYATILEAQKKYKEAEEYLRKCVKLREDFLGPEHPGTAASLCNLGDFLKNRSRTKEAKEVYTIALKINRALYGGQSPQLSEIKGQLASVLQIEGNIVGAEEILLEIVKTEKKNTNNLIALSEYLNNLANIYKATKRYGKAEKLLKESLNCVERSLGKTHPRVGLAYWNLAVIQWKQKQSAASKKSWDTAMDVYVQTLGHDNPQVQRCNDWWSNKK